MSTTTEVQQTADEFRLKTDAEMRSWLESLERSGACCPRDLAKVVWQETCRRALGGLTREQKKDVMNLSQTRFGGGYQGDHYRWCRGQNEWNQIATEYRERAGLMSLAQKALRGQVGRWRNARENRQPSRYVPHHFYQGLERRRRVWDDRIEWYLRRGVSRTFGLHAYQSGMLVKACHVRNQPRVRGRIEKNEIWARVDRDWLRSVAWNGLHALPHGTPFLILKATDVVHMGSGVWAAQAAWIVPSGRGSCPTEGWIAWSYEPGPRGTILNPGVVDIVVRGPTLQAAMRKFWRVHQTIHGQHETPADRQLRHELLGGLPPVVAHDPEDMMSDEDAEAFADLAA